MNKGISFYWGFIQKPELAMQTLSKLGFDCVITCTDKKYNYQNGNLKQQVRLIKKYNLKPSSLHGWYHREKSAYLWVKGIKGYFIYRKLVRDIKLANKYGFNTVVMHLYGEPSKIGIKRLKNVLKYCEKFNVPLAIENVRNRKLFEYAFENIDNSYLKFCYDIGHNNAYDKEIDYLTIYGNRLQCLHLHDNMGQKDDHTLNKYGSIDWKQFAEKLKEINYKGNLDYEIFMHIKNNETAEEVAKEVLDQSKYLEKIIEGTNEQNN